MCEEFAIYPYIDTFRFGVMFVRLHHISIDGVWCGSVIFYYSVLVYILGYPSSVYIHIRIEK